MSKTTTVVADKATIHVGRVAFAPGQTLALPDAHAQDLLAAGLVKLPGAPEAAKAPEPAPEPAPAKETGG